MADDVPEATRLVRQTLEQLIKEYPWATDAQLLKLVEVAARADDELKEAVIEWIRKYSDHRHNAE
jgi:hypothetical protein